MAEGKSPAQVREEYMRKMGPELGGIFRALWNELAWLNVKWQQYCQLFATSSKPVELLNASAGFLFGMVRFQRQRWFPATRTAHTSGSTWVWDRVWRW
jgi:hypothetical protein